jgi:hypothetical protein
LLKNRGVTRIAFFVFFTLPIDAQAVAFRHDTCGDVREVTRQRTAVYGWPQIVAKSGVEPNSLGERSDRYRVGLSWNLAEFSQKNRADQRADAECDLIEKEERLSQEIETQLSRAAYAGLMVRIKSLEQFLAEAEATFASKRKKLTAHLETRDDVNRAATEIFQLKTLLIESNEELRNIEVTSHVEKSKLETPVAVSTDRLHLDVEAAAVTARSKIAADRLGPAWDLVLNGGYEKRTALDRDLSDHGKAFPAYAELEFRWKLGHVIARGDESGSENRQKESPVAYSESTKEFAQKKQLYVEGLEKKIDLAGGRILQIKSDLAAIAGTREHDSSVFADTLSQALKIQVVNLEDWRARLAVLKLEPSARPNAPPADKSGPPAVSPKKGSDGASVPDAWLPRDPYRKFQVTKGRVGKTPSGLLHALDEKIRAELIDSGGILNFRSRARYRGATEKIIPLGSGVIRKQFGVFLASKDQCNRLYVMWRAPANHDAGRFVVQKKINAGGVTHADCENRGYEPVVAKLAPPINIAPNGEEFTFDVRVERGNLSVVIGDRTVWEGMVDLAGLDPVHGSIGFRSDNVNVDFAIEKSP